jgi:outer membrane protein OmpA-like peptidoglycan-associated protein
MAEMGTWTTKFRGPALVAGVMAVSLALNPALAAAKSPKASNDLPPSKSRHIGAGSGFLIGAVAGGPIGAAVGAATGAWLGERNQRKKLEIEAGQQKAAVLRNEIDALNGSLTQIEGRAGEVGSTIQFRTGETLVRDADRARLAKLGALVAGLSDVQIRVSGFADSRGSDELNLSLSKERAEMVANELMKAGVPKERLVVEALGERFAAMEASADDQAFERSVEVRLERASGQVASN